MVLFLICGNELYFCLWLLPLFLILIQQYNVVKWKSLVTYTNNSNDQIDSLSWCVQVKISRGFNKAHILRQQAMEKKPLSPESKQAAESDETAPTTAIKLIADCYSNSL